MKVGRDEEVVLYAPYSCPYTNQLLARSSQPGLADSISRSFFSRDQPLICRSRANAARAWGVDSK
jgi:hypothetical protein